MAWEIAAALIAAQVASTASTVMASRQQSKNIKAAAAFDRYQRDLQRKQDIIKANRQAEMLLSEKRAAIGARGVQLGTGTTLLDTQSVIDELEDARFWIEKNVEMDLLSTNIEEANLLSSEAVRRRTALVEGVVRAGTTAYVASRPATSTGKRFG